MAKISANYEVVYIIDPAQSEEAIAATVAKFQTLAEQNGSDVVDGVSKTALAPLVNTGQSAVSLHDTLEFFHESRDTLFTLRGVDDIEDLILCGKFCHDVAPPSGLMAAGPACGKDRLRFADRFIIAGKPGKVNWKS